MTRFRPLSLFIVVPLALAFLLPSARADGSADVIVYGATPGGFCAAIAAAREGSSVILLEPSAHVGGVNTGGLSFSDSNQTVRSTVMGLFDEWHRRIEKDYQQRGITLPYDVSVKDNSKWTYEPSVAAKITHKMLAEAGVKVLPRHVLTAVKKDGARITQVVTDMGEFRARVFINGTYEGDLMAAAGVSWTIGRESREAFGESFAGRQYPKAKLPISGFDDDGKLLPLLTTTDAGDDAAGDDKVMVYSFRLCLTRDPANRVDFPAPENYDPARFEIIRRYYQQQKRPHLLWDIYPLPNGKFDANNGIGKQFSMGLVGGGNRWSEADPAGRAEIWRAHKQYTLELYHFLTTDAAVPEHLREQLAAFGLCSDEFADTDHWSPQLYVREARRMQGLHVLTQSDIIDHPEKADAIAVSSFPIDSHDCRRIALPLSAGGGVINEGTIFPVRMEGRKHGYPYQVPYRSLLPRPEQCDNLLVPVALSSSHVAISSIRVEPTWMILGQSAGVAAALTVEDNTSVQDLDYSKLRQRLLASGQVIDLPVLAELPPEAPEAEKAVNIDPASLPGIVLDDQQAELHGKWTRSTNFKPHIGSGYLHDESSSDGKSIAVFKFTAPKTARYQIRVAYSPHETRAIRVPVVIENGSHKTELHFDQTQALPFGKHFRNAGVVDLSTESQTTITIRNHDTDGFVILDALQLIEMDE